MAQDSGNLFLRNDTIFGICEGIGQDFGFNPNWLRIAFAAGMFFNPLAMIGAYLALGLVVLASRLIAPRSRVATLPQRQHAPAVAISKRDETLKPELPLAA